MGELSGPVIDAETRSLPEEGIGMALRELFDLHLQIEFMARGLELMSLPRGSPRGAIGGEGRCRGIMQHLPGHQPSIPPASAAVPILLLSFLKLSLN